MSSRLSRVRAPQAALAALAALLCALALAACGGGADAPQPPPAGPEIVVRRDSLSVAAGQQETIRADRLVVANGARIDGTLKIAPLASSATSAFTLVVERGDLVVAGAIEWLAADAAAAGTQRVAHALAAQGAKRASASPGVGQKDLVVEVPGGDVHLHSTSALQARRGADAATLVVTEPVDATAPDGGRGGDIAISARVIHIQREEVERVGGQIVLKGPRLFLGYGGKGGSIEVDDMRFVDAMPRELTFQAGSGGRSGELRLAGTIDLPPINGKIDAGGWRIDGALLGGGGWGGDVIWRVGDGHAFENLARVTLISGAGGRGASVGGRGGLVRYQSRKVINSRALPQATAVLARSGAGGDVDATLLNGGENSAVQLYVDGEFGTSFGFAGSGGPVVAWGNSGAQGDPSNPQGQPGGPLTVHYGPGGRITSARVHPLGVGGFGGGLFDPLGLDQIVDAQNFATPLAVGTGGDGADFCGAGNDRAGGAGGDSGALVVRLGAGGDGPVPGSAGTLDYAWITFSAPGQGGSGNPLGSNGREGPVVLHVAAGGSHPDDPAIVGPRSAVQGTKVATLVPDPTPCDGGPEPPPQTYPYPMTERDSWSTVYTNGRQERRTVITTFTPGALVPGTTLAPLGITWTDEGADGVGNSYSTAGETSCEADLTNATTRATQVSCRNGTCSTRQLESKTFCQQVNVLVGLRGRYDPADCVLVPNGGGRAALMASDGSPHGWTVTIPPGNRTSSYEYQCIGLTCTARTEGLPCS